MIAAILAVLIGIFVYDRLPVTISWQRRMILAACISGKLILVADLLLRVYNWMWENVWNM